MNKARPFYTRQVARKSITKTDRMNFLKVNLQVDGAGGLQAPEDKSKPSQLENKTAPPTQAENPINLQLNFKAFEGE